MASEEASTLLGRQAAAKVAEGTNSNIVENESANTVFDKPIDLISHRVACTSTKESLTADSAATSSCCPSREKLAKRGRLSNKKCEVLTGQAAKADEERVLPHNLREPANICHKIQEMQQDTLLNVPKLVDAGYTPILTLTITKEGIDVYITSNVNFIMSREAVLREWRMSSDLRSIPLEDKVTKDNAITQPLRQLLQMNHQQSYRERRMKMVSYVFVLHSYRNNQRL